jgi:hypothetical protein
MGPTPCQDEGKLPKTIDLDAPNRNQLVWASRILGIIGLFALAKHYTQDRVSSPLKCCAVLSEHSSRFGGRLAGQ